jgi:hypothetical protein
MVGDARCLSCVCIFHHLIHPAICTPQIADIMIAWQQHWSQYVKDIVNSLYCNIVVFAWLSEAWSYLFYITAWNLSHNVVRYEWYCVGDHFNNFIKSYFAKLTLYSLHNKGEKEILLRWIDIGILSIRDVCSKCLQWAAGVFQPPCLNDCTINPSFIGKLDFQYYVEIILMLMFSGFIRYFTKWWWYL